MKHEHESLQGGLCSCFILSEMDLSLNPIYGTISGLVVMIYMKCQ